MSASAPVRTSASTAPASSSTRPPNRYEWPVVQYATARIGAILVNINPSYRTTELEFVLNQSGVSVLLLARGYRQLEYAPMLEEVRPRCPGLRHALQLDRGWGDL